MARVSIAQRTRSSTRSAPPSRVARCGALGYRPPMAAWTRDPAARKCWEERTRAWTCRCSLPACTVRPRP